MFYDLCHSSEIVKRAISMENFGRGLTRLRPKRRCTSAEVRLNFGRDFFAKIAHGIAEVLVAASITRFYSNPTSAIIVA